ncbi:MAG: metallophosphoesterase [Sporomusaceae bacterium]|nr:metallophosphoesterase [Sporomusaceae bacterium]
MRILVMSDIHGEYDIMQRVLDKGKYDPKQDKLILLGDYIDRGNQAKQVIAAIKEFIANGAIALLGNHEKIMIDALAAKDYRLWDINGGVETRSSYHNSLDDMKEDAEFLKTLPLYYETENYLFTHAGITPGIAIEDQTERVLLWSSPEEYIGIYKGKTLVCGHTPVQSIMDNQLYNKPFRQGDILFIDTGMGWRQNLTLLDLTQKIYWQSWHRDKTKEPYRSAKLDIQYSA